MCFVGVDIDQAHVIPGTDYNTSLSSPGSPVSQIHSTRIAAPSIGRESIRRMSTTALGQLLILAMWDFGGSFRTLRAEARGGCYTAKIGTIGFFWWEPLLDRRVRSSHFCVSLSFGHQVRLLKCVLWVLNLRRPWRPARPESPRVTQSHLDCGNHGIIQ